MRDDALAATKVALIEEHTVPVQLSPATLWSTTCRGSEDIFQVKVAEKKSHLCRSEDLWTSFVPALEEAPPQILPTLNFSATPYSKTRISGFLKRTVKRKTFFSSE